MKKLILLFISVCCFNSATSQNNAIKLTNLNTNKEKVIKENKRIKLTTTDGRKLKGRFKVEDNNTISIYGTKINIADIEELKRNPLLTSALTSGFLVYAGAITVGFSLIIAALADATALWLVLPAAGMIYAGIKSPNFNKNHKLEKGWTFEIIPLSD
jgi:hypothetical protein